MAFFAVVMNGQVVSVIVAPDGSVIPDTIGITEAERNGVMYRTVDANGVIGPHHTTPVDPASLNLDPVALAALEPNPAEVGLNPANLAAFAAMGASDAAPSAATTSTLTNLK